MHVLTEAGSLGVHVLGAAGLGAAGCLVLVQGLAEPADQPTHALARRRGLVQARAGNRIVRQMLLLPIGQRTYLFTSHAAALVLLLGMCDRLLGLHPLEHQHRHQLGTLLTRKAVIGAHQAASFVETLVNLTEGSALGRLQSVAFVLP
ncbi:hypothetical protein D3C80_967170 [compost metagenome]